MFENVEVFTNTCKQARLIMDCLHKYHNHSFMVSYNVHKDESGVKLFRKKQTKPESRCNIVDSFVPL